MSRSFDVLTATTDWVKSVQKTMFEFRLPKVTQTKPQSGQYFNYFGIMTCESTATRGMYKSQKLFLEDIKIY